MWACSQTCGGKGSFPAPVVGARLLTVVKPPIFNPKQHWTIPRSQRSYCSGWSIVESSHVREGRIGIDRVEPDGKSLRLKVIKFQLSPL